MTENVRKLVRAEEKKKMKKMKNFSKKFVEDLRDRNRKSRGN